MVLKTLMNKRKYVIRDKNSKPVVFYRGGFIDFAPNEEMHHFSDRCEVAAEHSPLNRCYIWLKNPLIVDFNNQQYEYTPIEDIQFYPSSFSEIYKRFAMCKLEQDKEAVLADTLNISLCAKGNGYDGVLFLNIRESDFDFSSCDVTVFREENLFKIHAIKEAEAKRIIVAEQKGEFDSSIDLSVYGYLVE